MESRKTQVQISLKAARTNANLTQKQAAKMLNVTEKTISKWENGKSFPDALKIMDIEKTYNISYDEIIFLSRNSTLSVK